MADNNLTATDYTAGAVDASKAVMVELTHLLHEYQDNILIIGGWVPELLAHGGMPPHVGSMDVDLALDQRKLQEAGYQSIRRLLEDRGYYQKPGRYPFKFFRQVPVTGSEEPIEVEVDLLAGTYEGTGKSHKHQKLQDDLQPLKARGCEFAFDQPARDVPLTATLPGGGQDSVTLRVASIVPFLMMKGIALKGRIKEKDAYDIVYCLKNYPGGVEAVAEECRPHLSHGIVREGLGHIARAFASPEATGPTWYANFIEADDLEERERAVQDAYQQVTAFLETAGYIPGSEEQA